MKGMKDMEMMKAIVKKAEGRGFVSVQEVPVPRIGPKEALIRIKAVGVCGTDVHIYNGDLKTATPVIVGHELAGIVERLGSEVKGFAVGDRVICRLNVGACGSCKACLSGNPQMCEQRTCPGHMIDGAFAEYMKIEEEQLISFGEQISMQEAALVEPMACVAHALLERTGVEPEDLVVLFGPGPIGLMALQMAKQYGASKVIVVGADSDRELRFPLAEKLGADEIINADREDVVAAVERLTEGKGADLCIECSGAEAAINAGIQSLRKQGRMCVIGLPGVATTNVQWLLAAQRSLKLIFSYSSSPSSWNLCLSMLKRRAINVKSLISHRASLDEFLWILAEMKAGRAMKVILLPSNLEDEIS